MDFSRRSSRFVGSQDQTALQQLHEQAKELLEQKNNEIDSLNNELDKAEKKLVDVKNQLQTIINTPKMKDDHIAEDELPPEMLDEIENLKAKQEQEIQKIQQENEEEVNALEKCYDKQLKEAESWAEQHADQIVIEKRTELQNLQRELDSLKAKLADGEFTSTKTKFDLLAESKAVTMTNEQKIQYLENQLGELTSLAREELKEIRTKINETVSAYNIRQKEHQNEIAHYENEIKVRSASYDMHIEALTQQFESEKAKYTTAIETSDKKYSALQRVLKQIDKQHEKQLSVAIHDNEKMKTTIYSIKTRDAAKMESTMTEITHSHVLEQQCQQVQNDITIIEQDIKELLSENKDLEGTLAKFERLNKRKAGMF